MKTITFYSYKGGVGRTMALANIAKRMVDLGKKVCILDFDLEAPGIQHKFADYLHTTKVEKGLVDYVYQFVESGNVPINLAEFRYSVQIGTNKTKPIDFIFAGDIYSSEYWKKLSGISWKELFYQDNSEGIPFFIDLRLKRFRNFLL